jgi:hypothetical protein
MHMVTRAQFTTLALSLPETVQASHFGKPDFRVRGKIFAGLDQKAPRASIKMRKDLQAVVVGARPQAFEPAEGAWGTSGWTYVLLEQVSLDELQELVAEAWQLIAPARLVAQHQGPAEHGELSITPSRAAASPEPAPPRRAASKKASAKKATARKATARKATARKAKKKHTAARARATAPRQRPAR